MEKKIRLDVTIFLIVAAIIISSLTTGLIINKKVSDLTSVQSAFAKIKNIDDLVSKHYIGAIDSEQIADYMAKGYVAGLGDVYAMYYSKDEYRAYQSTLTGQYEGIGLTVNWVDNVGLEVTRVSRNSPAETAGVQIGDIITMVEETSVLTLGYDEAINRLTGSVGTIAFFTVDRNGTILKFEVLRSQYEQVTVEYALLGNIGYIKITGFNDLTSEYFNEAVKALEEQSVKGYIFDVRNNPGGTIDSVVEVVDRVIGKGVVATTLRKDDGSGSNKTTYEAVTATELDKPVVVLADGNTASGGELFTAALMDHDKAVFIGQTTYGKGTGQTFYKLPDGSYLKITDFTYYPPSGTSYQQVGITPDVKITLTEHQIANRYTLPFISDPYIIAAFEELGADIKSIDSNQGPNNLYDPTRPIDPGSSSSGSSSGSQSQSGSDGEIVPGF